MNLDLVEDVCAVRAAQAAALDPGGGVKACGIGAGCEDARVGGDDLVSLLDGEAECQKVGDGRAASAQLGKGLQIQILKCSTWFGQAFEGDAAGIALQLGNECRVCLPCGGTEAYVDAGFRS